MGLHQKKVNLVFILIGNLLPFPKLLRYEVSKLTKLSIERIDIIFGKSFCIRLNSRFCHSSRKCLIQMWKTKAPQYSYSPTAHIRSGHVSTLNPFSLPVLIHSSITISRKFLIVSHRPVCFQVLFLQDLTVRIHLVSTSDPVPIL